MSKKRPWYKRGGLVLKETGKNVAGTWVPSPRTLGYGAGKEPWAGGPEASGPAPAANARGDHGRSLALAAQAWDSGYRSYRSCPLWL